MKAILPLIGAAAMAASAPAFAQLSPEALAQARAERCGAAPAEERARLQAERAALEARIADLAMGKRPRKKTSGGDVARGVAGTAASVLLPFPLGAALNAGAAAAGRGKKKAQGPDPAPLLARVAEIDARLARLEGC